MQKFRKSYVAFIITESLLSYFVWWKESIKVSVNNINKAKNKHALETFEHKKKDHTAYGVGNPCPALEQAHLFLGVKQVNVLDLIVVNVQLNFEESKWKCMIWFYSVIFEIWVVNFNNKDYWEIVIYLYKSWNPDEGYIIIKRPTILYVNSYKSRMPEIWGVHYTK